MTRPKSKAQIRAEVREQRRRAKILNRIAALERHYAGSDDPFGHPDDAQELCALDAERRSWDAPELPNPGEQLALL